jgi:hypothetical protein
MMKICDSLPAVQEKIKPDSSTTGSAEAGTE